MLLDRLTPEERTMLEVEAPPSRLEKIFYIDTGDRVIYDESRFSSELEATRHALRVMIESDQEFPPRYPVAFVD